jgi:hypothetical protein
VIICNTGTLIGSHLLITVCKERERNRDELAITMVLLLPVPKMLEFKND